MSKGYAIRLEGPYGIETPKINDIIMIRGPALGRPVYVRIYRPRLKVWLKFKPSNFGNGRLAFTILTALIIKLSLPY